MLYLNELPNLMLGCRHKHSVSEKRESMAKSGFQVLYIDDDEFMLKAAGRLLRRLKPEWSIHLLQEAVNWRTFTNQQHICPDLVMSDLIMPELRGDQLLAQVARHFPNSIRALITGDTTVEITALSNNWAHFILPKPFTEKDFEQILSCAERLGSLPFSDACRQKLSGIESLPVLPSVVRKLERCIDNEQCAGVDFAHIVANEPPLAAQVLKAANSVYLGFETRTNSLSTAVSRLGMKVVCGIAMTMMTRNAFHRVSDQEHDEVVAYHQRLASLSGAIARKLHWPVDQQEDVYLVCLLSSIGTLVLKESGYVCETDDCAPLALHRGYRDADVIGGYILILWGCDLPIVEVILTLGQANAVSDDPTQWKMGQLVQFCQMYLQAQENASLDAWMSTLPNPLAHLARWLRSAQE